MKKITPLGVIALIGLTVGCGPSQAQLECEHSGGVWVATYEGNRVQSIVINGRPSTILIPEYTYRCEGGQTR